MKKISADIVVIGSGIAGLFYALKCAAFSKVLIITKGKIGESNTMFAQGGIAAVFGTDDSTVSHKLDTMVTGDGLSDETVTDFVVSNARKCILELERLRVHFDKNDSGGFDLHKEGGHSHARVVHTVDATGREVENSLVKAVLSNNNISVKENCFVVDLIIEEDCCKGIIALEKEDSQLLEINSKIVMLATGGAGQIYALNTNPTIATGDGYAIAYRAGAELKNMEFVQFHPTVLYSPGKDTFLITEALRGFGAELKDSKEKTFMEKYHPMKSLAPRDIVSRAIFNELRRSNDNCVFLDAKGIDATELKNHFPTIFNTLKEQGINCTKEMIPVVPAAHYMCGGVAVNLNSETTIKNLFACGEVACTGLHGANRLASNSLLEGLVFAEQAAITTERRMSKTVHIGEISITKNLKLDLKEDSTIRQVKEKVQKTMWKYAGIVRSAEGLLACIKTLQDLHRVIRLKIDSNGLNVATLELLNLIETSLMVVTSALQRIESRGCHFREDFPFKSHISAIPEQINLKLVSQTR